METDEQIIEGFTWQDFGILLEELGKGWFEYISLIPLEHCGDICLIQLCRASRRSRDYYLEFGRTDSADTITMRGKRPLAAEDVRQAVKAVLAGGKVPCPESYKETGDFPSLAEASLENRVEELLDGSEGFKIN